MNITSAKSSKALYKPLPHSRFSLIANPLVSCQEDKDEAIEDIDADEEYDSDEKEKMKDRISKKLKIDKGHDVKAEPGKDEGDKKTSRR